MEIATWKWSTAGKLNTPRKEHGAIVLDSKFIVVGGPQNKQTEICSLGSGVGKVTSSLAVNTTSFNFKENEIEKFVCKDVGSLFDYRHPLLFVQNQTDINC